MEELRLLTAFIKAAGYKVETVWRHPSTGEIVSPPRFDEHPRRYFPYVDYIVTKIDK